MAQDNKEIPQDKIPVSSNRPPKKEVDIFPALIERNGVPVVPVRQSVAPRGGSQISMFTPLSYEEALEIVSCLRGRAATTISLEKMRKIDASRLVDFVSGASAAIDGDFHKLNDLVYLFCPSNMRIVADGKKTTTSATTQAGESPLDYLYPEVTSGSKRSFSNLLPRH